MSIMRACAEAEAVIARARSLFGSGGAVDVPDTAAHITTAATSVTTARSHTADMSGIGIRSYQAMSDGSVPPLTTAATSDTSLAAHVTTVAAVTQAGAARMDQISATTSAISEAAPMATSAAGQRLILTALRSQVSQASQVVQSTQQQASALAGQVRGLEYPKDTPVQYSWKEDPSSTTTTTTTPPKLPECGVEDIAKLQREVEDLESREDALRARINEFNKKAHEFDIRDPRQVQAAQEYERERAELAKERDALTREENELKHKIGECGIKVVTKGGQEVIEWPDGSTTPTPTPAPTGPR